MLHISTDEVFGSVEVGDKFSEFSPYNPQSPYSATKAAAEHFVTSWHNTYGLPYLITSSSNNYGPGQHEEKLIPKVVTNALRDEITYMHDGGEQIRDWIHVEDVCRAIAHLIPSTITGVVDIGTGESTSVLELAEVFHQGDLPIKEDTPGEPDELCADTTIMRSISWYPTYDVLGTARMHPGYWFNKTSSDESTKLETPQQEGKEEET